MLGFYPSVISGKISNKIGFNAEEQKKSIYHDSIDSFSDIKMFTEKHISDLSTDFAGRAQDNGKTNFGTCRTKRTKSLLH